MTSNDDQIKLSDFEHKVRVRPLTMADFDDLLEMQHRCFPGMEPWEREHIESQLRIFPEGQIGVEVEGKVVASCSSLVVDFSQYSAWHNWPEIADDGYIRNHDPEGDTLYGIEIMVHPDYRGMKLARRLYDARKELARQMNLARIIIAGRIPGYSRYANDMSAREYADRVVSKELYDPVLTPQLANGFVLKGLIPDYLPSDSDSRGYATYLEWPNLDYQPTSKRRLKAVSQVRICVVQYKLRPVKSFDEFAEQCEFYVDVASDHRCDFVVFPELVTLQLLPLIKANRPGLAARQLDEFTPRYLEMFSRMAVRYDVNIVGGSQFTVEGDTLYNVAYLFRRDGTLGKQYNLHIEPNDQRWWGAAPGNRVEAFDTDCGRVAIQLSYDVQFPEITRVAAHKGARLLFVPFSAEERNGYLRVRSCAQARAIENHLYVVIAGTVGNLPFVDNADIHYAQSAVLTPADFPFSRDAVAAEGPSNIENVFFCDLDLELLRRHKSTGTVRNLHDRRRDLYRVYYLGDEEPLEV